MQLKRLEIQLVPPAAGTSLREVVVNYVLEKDPNNVVSHRRVVDVSGPLRKMASEFYDGILQHVMKLEDVKAVNRHDEIVEVKKVWYKRVFSKRKHGERQK